jgi:hypothetical protein
LAYIYVGRRIYYLKTNGQVVLSTGEAEGWVYEHDIDSDFKVYDDLKQYKKEEVDFIDLKFGEFKTEFSECTSYRVNVDTKQLEFDYTPVPEPPDVPHTPTVHERLDALEQVNAEQDMLIMEMSGLMV